MVAARGSASPPAMTRSERCFRVSSGLDLEFLIWRGPVKHMQSCPLARPLQPPQQKREEGSILEWNEQTLPEDRLTAWC
jgi:hypothetical protein